MKILFLADFVTKHEGTVKDHKDSFTTYSKFTIVPVNAYLSTPESNLNFDEFDAIIIHYSLAIVYDSYLQPSTRHAISKFKKIKAIFIQDEYRWLKDEIDCMKALGINLLFTCVPSQEIDKVYPEGLLPNVKKINVLTGYVPQNLLGLSLPSYEQRSLDVVYRSRKLSAGYGRLCLYKWQIADKFLPFAKNHNLNVDLSYSEQDRFLGNTWIKFLMSSKCSLGVESGASVFDFTGDIVPNCQQYEKEHPDATFEEIEKKFFPGLDGKVNMGQISPRVFECAAVKTMLVMLEGNYSGILIPWRHYVPLKKDFSNIEEVIAAIKSKATWSMLTEQTYQEIACNDRFSYRTFVRMVDQEIEALWNEQPGNFAPVKISSLRLSPVSPKNVLIIKYLLLYQTLNKIFVKTILFVFKIMGFSDRFSDNFIDFLKNIKNYFIQLRASREAPMIKSIDNYLREYQQKLIRHEGRHYFCLNKAHSFLEKTNNLIVPYSTKISLMLCDTCRWYVKGR